MLFNQNQKPNFTLKNKTQFQTAFYNFCKSKLITFEKLACMIQKYSNRLLNETVFLFSPLELLFNKFKPEILLINRNNFFPFSQLTSIILQY